MFKNTTPNRAISQRLSGGESVRNNAAIVEYQARTIGQLERQYAAGEISEQQYRQRYGEYSEVIRGMGR